MNSTVNLLGKDIQTIVGQQFQTIFTETSRPLQLEYD